MRYGSWGEEQLTLRADGSFEQAYQGLGARDEPYRFKSKTRWSIEPLAGGFYRLHLPGLRYNVYGLNGQKERVMYYDPFVNKAVKMENELILHVRQDASGQLILHHLFLGADEGFPIFGAESLIFRRVGGNNK